MALVEPGKPSELNYNQQNLTPEYIKSKLPKKSKHMITPEVMKMLHSMEDDIDVLQSYMEESFLGNLNVLNEARVSVPEYINAIKFVALRQNMNSINSYAIVFPKKYKWLMDKKASGKSVNEYNYASAYEGTQAVQKISAQAMVLPNLLSAKYNMEAKAAMWRMMNNKDASFKVQLDAAIGLEAATKAKEDNTFKLEITQNDMQLEQQKLMNENIQRLIEVHRGGFEEGADLAQIQKIHVEIHDVEIDT